MNDEKYLKYIKEQFSTIEQKEKAEKRQKAKDYINLIMILFQAFASMLGGIVLIVLSYAYENPALVFLGSVLIVNTLYFGHKYFKLAEEKQL